HAAVPTRIEEHVGLSRPVAAEDHRFLTHPRDEEVPGVRDLALMPDKEPGSGEDPLQLLAVDLVVDKDLAADPARRRVDETGPITLSPCGRHRRSPVVAVTPAEAGAVWDLPPGTPPRPRSPARAARNRPSPRESAQRPESPLAPSLAPGRGSARR